jgi:hypothetical protein
VLQGAFPFTEEKWQQMLTVLQAMKPALVVRPGPPAAVAPQHLRRSLSKSRLRGMEPATTRQLQVAIERLHGGKCRYVETVQVTDEWEGKPIWSQAVHVFALEGNPTATHAFVWAEPVGGVGPKQRFTAILQQGPIKSSLDAVRASIIEAVKEKEGR